MFKTTHPADLVSRMFVLEYIKDLKVDKVKPQLSEGEQKFWLYKFEGEGQIEYDFNWEYLLFVIPLENLSKIMERFIDDIEIIEVERQSKYKAFRDQQVQEELAKPADINLYDLARADMKSQSTKLT